MSHARKIDPITGTIKQPLLRVLLGGVMFFGVFIFLAVFLPYYSPSLLLIASSLGGLGVITMIWLNIKPNLWAKFFCFVSISSLCTVIAIRAFGYLLPQFPLFGILIIFTVIPAHVLPIWDLETTKFLRGELSITPETRTGKVLLKYSLKIMPIAGFISASIGLFRHTENYTSAIAMLILGPLCWFLALILPFSTRQSISPWEYRKQKRTEAK